MQSTAIYELLETLKGEVSSLWYLNYNVAEEIREVLAQVELLAKAPTPREIALRYMASVSNAQLRRDVLEARGERSSACFRTKFNADLEAIVGRRHQVGGQARVNSNGAARAA